MTWLDDAENAVSEAASSVAQTVENTAQAVEQKAADIVQTVENKAADVVQTVENKASDAVDAVEEKASQAAGAAQGAWSSFKDKAADAVDTVEQKAKDLVDEGGKAVDAIEKKAKEAEQAAVKWVHSIEGPIARILAPNASSNSIISDIFGDKDDDPNLAPLDRLSISAGGPKDAMTEDGKYRKDTPITASWQVIAPSNQGVDEPVNISVELVETHWYHDSRTVLVQPTSQLVGQVTAKVQGDCYFHLVAWCTNHLKYKSDKGKNETKSAEIAVKEDEEYEGPEPEVKFGQSAGFDWDKPIVECPYLKASLKAAVAVSVDVDLLPKLQSGEAKSDLVHFITHHPKWADLTTVLKAEGKSGESGLKVIAGADDHTQLNGKEEKATEVKFGLAYELTLAAGTTISVEFDALSITVGGHEGGEVKFFSGGADASFEGTLSGFETGGVSVDGSFKVSVGIEAEPEWGAIAKSLATELTTDAAITAILTTGFILGGVITIAGLVKALADVAELKELSGRLKPYADGYYRGYLCGLSANLDYTDAPGEGDGAEGYEKGKPPGMTRRLDGIAKLRDDLGKTPEDAARAFDDWWKKNHTSLVGPAQAAAFSAAQNAVWDQYAPAHMDIGVGMLMCRRAFHNLFGVTPDDAGYNARWRKYCPADASDDQKKGIF